MSFAEELTARWLMSMGYFVMSNLKEGRHEVDLVGAKLADDKKTVAGRVHVEISVSSSPRRTKRTVEEDRAAADDYTQRKFKTVDPFLQTLLGGGYERWRVIGKLGGGQAEQPAQEQRSTELGIRVVRFAQVVKEYVSRLRTRPLDDVGGFVHTLAKLDLLNTHEEK
jgi:hypothetical protein